MNYTPWVVKIVCVLHFLWRQVAQQFEQCCLSIWTFVAVLHRLNETLCMIMLCPYCGFSGCYSHNKSVRCVGAPHGVLLSEWIMMGSAFLHNGCFIWGTQIEDCFLKALLSKVWSFFWKSLSLSEAICTTNNDQIELGWTLHAAVGEVSRGFASHSVSSFDSFSFHFLLYSNEISIQRWLLCSWLYMP